MQMADPLTALIHAVQVMNFLKTLIVKTLQEREESAAASRCSSCLESPGKDESPSPKPNRETGGGSCKPTIDVCVKGETAILGNFLRSPAKEESESEAEERFWSLEKMNEADEEHVSISWSNTPIKCDIDAVENGCSDRYSSGDVEGFLDRLSLRKGVKKLCRHPVFQLSKPVKKSGSLGIVDNRGRGREAWA